ncbi:MAG: radical SAM protein [Magnetococcales bacterium]|nr:radical SAM protein [Magnetococcales bacterium]
MIREMKAFGNFFLRSSQTALRESLQQLPKLEHVVYEITDRCNSKCVHCNIWQNKGTKDMTNEEIERIFSSGAFRHLNDVIITGGEPVLRSGITDNMLAIQRNVCPDAQFSLSTNGLLPERVLDTTRKCLEKGMRLIVGVSLDGLDERHDAARGVKGNFGKVDALLKELIRMRDASGSDKLTVTVGYTLSPKTAGNLDEVAGYVCGLGLRFLPQMFEEFEYYSNNSPGNFAYFADAHGDANEEMRVMIQALESIQPSFQKELFLSLLHQGQFPFKCASLKSFFLMRSNGDISPCLRYSETRIGNLREASFEEIWHSKKMAEARTVVANCRGCSNTWATGWSMRYWMPPFFKLLAIATIKKHLNKSHAP